VTQAREEEEERIESVSADNWLPDHHRSPVRRLSQFLFRFLIPFHLHCLVPLRLPRFLQCLFQIRAQVSEVPWRLQLAAAAALARA
jgi:hypothetical protein